MLDRRAFVSGVGLGLVAPAVLRAAEPGYVTIETNEGRLRGQRVNGVSVFKGVRYAAPAIAYRFRKPGRLQSWTGVRDALEFGAPAIQPIGQGPPLPGPKPAEDCLFLNLWTPATRADGRKRPVMFYLHGGGFTTGSGAAAPQDGANLARNNDVVVIETNHRLGILGHLFLGDILGEEYATSGNQSLFDMVEGLDWVKRNVEAFGGDPGNVMVWGESGGGWKTSAIYAFSPAAPLFHKASIESGPGIRMASREQATATARFVLDQLGIAPKDARKLLEVSAEKLLEIQQTPVPGPALVPRTMPRLGDAAGSSSYAPVVDGRYLQSHPFASAAPAISRNKPLMVGGNLDEATFFLLTGGDRSVLGIDEAGLQQRLKNQYGDGIGAQMIAAYRRDMPGATPAEIALAIQSDDFSAAGSSFIAGRKVEQGGAPVWLYRLTEGVKGSIPGTTHPLGATHALDIYLKFDNVDPSDVMGVALSKEEYAELSKAAKAMSQFWTSFARNSRPVAQGQPSWPQYDLTRRPIMLIQAECSVVDDWRPTARKVWESL